MRLLRAGLVEVSKDAGSVYVVIPMGAHSFCYTSQSGMHGQKS